MFGKIFDISIVIFSVYFIFIGNAYSQTVTPVAHLSFGTIVLKDNDSVHSYTISETGVASYGSSIIIFTPGNRGQYELANFPGPNPELLTINVDAGSLTDGDSGIGNAFTLDNPVHSDSTTDVNGALTLYIGGRLRTSGNGSMYTDSNYYDLVNIEVVY